MSLAAIAAALVALSGAGPAFAQLPLTMTKSFAPSTVKVGGSKTTTMTVTITNPNGFAVTGIAFSDTYPAGLVPDQIGAYTCAAGSAVFNGSGFSFANATLAAGASCSVPILMHATLTGLITNTTSQVTATGVPPGGPASATLTVNAVAPPGVVGVPADSVLLRALQLAVTRVEAQASGAAFQGAIDGAIADGFSDGGSPITSNGGGLRFNFAA